jgi:tagaturonate epimerase
MTSPIPFFKFINSSIHSALSHFPGKILCALRRRFYNLRLHRRIIIILGDFLMADLPENVRRWVSVIGNALLPYTVVETSDGAVFLARPAEGAGDKCLCVISALGAPPLAASLIEEKKAEGLLLRRYRCDHAAAGEIRRMLPWTAPVLIGITTSVGLGDRLGLATPGHIRAMRRATACDPEKTSVVRSSAILSRPSAPGGKKKNAAEGRAAPAVRPFFAQQSIREMTRTERTPEQVMDDALWGVLQEGWTSGFGADADHLKTPEHADRTAAAGFTMFTIDPGDHVDNAAAKDGADALRVKAAALPWVDLESTQKDLLARYSDKLFKLPGDVTLQFSAETALRAAVKYGRAVAHTVKMGRRIAQAAAGRPWELEMSVDETDTPTTPEEHFFVASELARLGVRPVGLAPRFVGAFEKGVDYLGDVEAFRAEIVKHAAVARELGPYKLSIHSGSDKFLIYEIAAAATGGLAHLKTAGTSYLEALRVIAAKETAFFREILAFARERWNEDRVSYHVSADLDKVREPKRDEDLPALLDQFDARQVLHCTFGSVLTSRGDFGAFRFRDRLYAALAAHEEEHCEVLARHLSRHIAPFVKKG